MSLEQKHLAAYFPYKLKLKGDDGIYTLIGLNKPYKTNDKCFITGEVRFENTTRIRSNVFNRDENKLIPILRPLSDLTKEDFSLFMSLYGLTKSEILECDIDYLPHGLVNFFYSHHFDIHNLIDKKEAVDINTLNQEK